MSEPEKPPVENERDPEHEPEPELDEVDIKDLLRAAMEDPPASQQPALLDGVQRKLRKRSRGRFYGDGWSITPEPRGTYLVTSVIMLIVIGIVFLVLVPWTADLFR